MPGSSDPGFWTGSSGGGATKPRAAAKPGSDTKAGERAQGITNRSSDKAEKDLVRIIGRLSAAKGLKPDQQDKLPGLLTGIRPHKVRRLAGEAELPEATTLELVDFARQAQGKAPLKTLAHREAKLTKVSEQAANRIKHDKGWQVEKAIDLASHLPLSYAKRATQALRDTGGNRNFVLEEAGSKLEGKGLGDVLAGAMSDPTTGAPNLLGTGLDLANRPSQAVLGGITEGPGGAWKGLTGKEQYSAIEAALRGLAGQSKAEAAKTEKGLPGYVSIPLNIGGAAVTDPLTYLSLGTSAAGRQALAHAGETIEANGGRAARDVIEGLANHGVKSLSEEELSLLNPKTLKLLEGAQGGVKFRGKTIIPSNNSGISQDILAGAEQHLPGVSTLEKAFVPRAGIKQAERAGESWAQGFAPKLESMIARLHGEQSLADRELVAKLQSVVRDSGVGSEEDLAQIRRGLDIREAEPALSEGQRQVTQELRTVLDDMLGREQQAGVMRELAPGEGTVPEGQYFPRVAGEQSVLDRVLRRGSPLTTKRGGYTQARAVDTAAMPVEDINPLRQAAGQVPFQEDPLKAVVTRGLQSNRDITNTRFVDELGSITDDTGAPLLQKATTLDEAKTLEAQGLVKKKITGVGDVYVPPEIAPEVSRVSAVISGDEATKAVLKGFDSYLTWWKGLATVPFPFSGGFSLRNMMGNWFLASYLPEKGVRATFKEYAQAARLQVEAASSFKNYGNPFIHSVGKDRQIIEDAYKLGAVGEGFYHTDVEQVVGKIVKPKLRDVGVGDVGKRVGGRANPLSPEFAPTAMGRTFNTAIEDNARLALFIRNYDALGPEGSAALVRKYLFDYTDLTAFERGVLKRISPFYTWARKSIPVMLESMVKTPGRWSRIKQVRDAVNEASAGQDTGPIPQWMLDQQGMLVGNGMFIPDLPYTTLADASHPGDFLYSQIGGPAGIAKTLAENKLGVTGFTGRTLAPGQQEQAPWYLAPFVGDAEVNAGQGKVPAVGSKFLNLLENAIPVLSKLRTVAPTSETDQDAATRRRINMLTGLNYWPLGDQTTRSEVLRRQKIADQIRQQLEYQGYEIPNTATLRKKAKTSSGGHSSDPGFWTGG